MSGQVERRPSTSSHITFAVLQQHFHLPISQVAKELGVCATVLKKICRQQGIPRWPHRKIKSLNKMISNLEEEMEAADTAEEKQQREMELRALKKKKAEIIETPSIIGPTYSHISPRLDGKPVNPISKFSSSGSGVLGTSEENLLREQNVRDILQTQRKLSAPAFSFSNASSSLNSKDFDTPSIPPAQSFYPPEFSSMGRNSYAPAYSQAQTDYHGRPSVVRSSAPDVLEGISSHQMEALYSMYSRQPPTGDRPFHPSSGFNGSTDEDRYPPYASNSSSNYLASFPHISNPPSASSHLPALEESRTPATSQFNYDSQRRDSFQGPSSLYSRSSDGPMHQNGYLPAPVKNERAEYPSLPHLSSTSAYSSSSSLDVNYGEGQKVQINQSAQYSSHNSGFTYPREDSLPSHHGLQHSYNHSHSLPYASGEAPYSRPNVPPLSRGFPDQKHSNENYTTSA